MKALGYVRVSTAEQGESGAGLEAQRAAILNEADRRLAEIVHIHQDVASGASTKNRPELQLCLERLNRGEADALLVARLDRLARSTEDTLRIVRMGTEHGWGLVPIDFPQLDTTSPVGEMVLTVLAAVAQFERKLGAQRTKEALAELRSQGVRLGRPPLLNPDVARRIKLRRRQDETYRSIAEALNRDGVLTATGRVWTAQNVRSVCRQP